MAQQRATETWEEWVRAHKLQTVGAMWATAVGTSFAYNLARPIPTSLKIIHSYVFRCACNLHAADCLATPRRIYAQAFTIAALLGAAAVELVSPASPEAVDAAAYHPHPAAAAAALHGKHSKHH